MQVRVYGAEHAVGRHEVRGAPGLESAQIPPAALAGKIVVAGRVAEHQEVLAGRHRIAAFAAGHHPRLGDAGERVGHRSLGTVQETVRPAGKTSLALGGALIGIGDDRVVIQDTGAGVVTVQLLPDRSSRPARGR